MWKKCFNKCLLNPEDNKTKVYLKKSLIDNANKEECEEIFNHINLFLKDNSYNHIIYKKNIYCAPWIILYHTFFFSVLYLQIVL